MTIQMIGCAGATLLTLAVGVSPTFAQAVPAARRAVRQDGGQVFVLDLEDGSTRMALDGRQLYKVEEPELSPAATHVSAVVWSNGVFGNNGFSIPPHPSLRIITLASSSELPPIQGAVAGVWCGDDCLAVVFGRYTENTEGGLAGDSALILHPISQRPPIRIALAGPSAVRWVPGDSVLFVQWTGSRRRTVSRVSLVDGSAEQVDIPSVDVSPSGRYYLSRPQYSAPLAVFEVATKRPVPLPARAAGYEPVEWSGGGDLLLVTKASPRIQPKRQPPGTRRPPPDQWPHQRPAAAPDYRLVNVRTDAVSSSWGGVLTRWRSAAGVQGRLFAQGRRVQPALTLSRMEIQP